MKYEYEYTLLASVVGRVGADGFSDAVKKANKICADSQKLIDASNLNLDLRIAVEMVQKVDD